MIRRTLTVLAVGTILMTVVPTASAYTGRGPCSNPKWDPRPSMPIDRIQRKVVAIVRCSTDRWSIPGGRAMAMCIAYRESHYYPWASNPSGAVGVYQQMVGYWPGRAKEFLKRKWFPGSRRNGETHWHWVVFSGWFMPRANVMLSIRMMHFSGLSSWGGGC